MPVRTDTLVIGAGSAGLFCALRWAERGSVTVVESGPDAGDPPPRWALYDYVLPEAHDYRYTDSATGKPVPQGRGLGGGAPAPASRLPPGGRACGSGRPPRPAAWSSTAPAASAPTSRAPMVPNASRPDASSSARAPTAR